MSRRSLVVCGPRAGEFSSAASLLLSGALPAGWEWVASSGNSVVARRMAPYPVYFKEYLERSPFERVKGWFRGSRCRRARRQGELLASQGFRTPMVLCWGSLGPREFVLTEGAKGLGLQDYLGVHWRPPLSEEMIRVKRLIIGELGNEIGRLHREGIFHGDLRPNNILIAFSPESQKPEFSFIDCERNRHYETLPMRLVRKNLVQIGMIFPPLVTLQDRARFLKAYCAACGRFSPKEARLLAERVHRRTRERLSAKWTRMNETGGDSKSDGNG